jgi:hypothetical protein
MGVSACDRYTVAHFVWGCSAHIAVPTGYFGPLGAFTGANFIHLLSEINENDTAPNGDILESRANHVFDQLSFATGWYFVWRVACTDHLCDNVVDVNPIVFLIASTWFWGALYNEMMKEIIQRREWEEANC